MRRFIQPLHIDLSVFQADGVHAASNVHAHQIGDRLVYYGPITLGLFFSNRAKSGSILRGILMTVWQLFLGLVVFGILEMLDNWRKKRK